MAARFTPEQLKKEAARIRERMRSGELAGPAAMQMLYDLNIDIRGDPIVTPEAQAEVEQRAQERQQELQKKRDARLKKINEVMPPAPERFAPEQGQPYQSPIPSPEQVNFPPGAPQLPIPNGGMSGGAGPFQPSPPAQQGPPNPLEEVTGSISPQAQPPQPPAPGGGMSIGIRNPMDNLAAAEAAWPGMAPGGMGVQPPQPPQPPGPPNPFAGLGDIMGGPALSPQVALEMGGALPGQTPGGPGTPLAGPLPPMAPQAPVSSYGTPRPPQARPEPLAPYANVGGPRLPQARPAYTSRALLSPSSGDVRQTVRDRAAAVEQSPEERVRNVYDPAQPVDAVQNALDQAAESVRSAKDLIAGPADAPRNSYGRYQLEGGYYPGMTKDDYLGDQEDEDEETSAGLSAADLAGSGLAVAETTGTYSGDGSDSSGVSPPPGIPPPESAVPLVELQPLIREERYVLPESSRNSQAFLGFGNKGNRPVKHVQVGTWEDPDYKFQKFGEPRTGSRLGAWIGGGLGFLGSAYLGGAGLIGTGIGTYAGQKLGRKIGGGILDPETGWGRRFTNPNFPQDIAQEEADIAANEYEKKYRRPFPGYTAAAGTVPVTRVIEERDLPPLIAEDNPNAILMANEGRQIAEAVKSDSIARDSMAREGGGTRTGGLFGSGYGSGNYGYSGGYGGWGGYGGGYGPDSIGGAYRNR